MIEESKLFLFHQLCMKVKCFILILFGFIYSPLAKICIGGKQNQNVECGGEYVEVEMF